MINNNYLLSDVLTLLSNSLINSKVFKFKELQCNIKYVDLKWQYKIDRNQQTSWNISYYLGILTYKMKYTFLCYRLSTKHR